MKSSRRDHRRSPRSLYPVLLAGFGISLLGVIWSLQGAERVWVELDPPDWDEVAQVDIGELTPEEWDKPVELRWEESPKKAFSIQMQQVDRREGDDAADVDVRMEFHCEESISIDGDDRIVERKLTARGLDVRHGDEDINRLLHQQVAMVLDAATYRFRTDAQGRTEATEWTEGTNPGLKPLAELVVAMQQMLTPRFPAEPILIGESWQYQMPLPVPGPGSRSPLTGNVDVVEQIEGIYASDESRIAVISRSLTLRIVDRDSESDAVVEAQGTGTVYFDFERGQLVASDLRIRRIATSIGEEDREHRGVTDVEAILVPAQHF